MLNTLALDYLSSNICLTHMYDLFWMIMLLTAVLLPCDILFFPPRRRFPLTRCHRVMVPPRRVETSREAPWSVCRL